MASETKMRQMVAAEMPATTPRTISSRASSAQLQRDRGTPVVAGSSQANCFTSTTTEGENSRGRPDRLLSSQPGKPLVENPLSPPIHDLGAGIHASRDLVVGQPIGRHQHDLGAHDPV